MSVPGLPALAPPVEKGDSGIGLDNIFVERLWRNVKHEDVYLKG